MLLRFSACNHLSIRDEGEISLVSSSLRDDPSGLIASSVSPTGYVLPVAIIYGANASGKSNYLHALDFARSCIDTSHRQGEPGGGVPRHPFALGKSHAAKPSTYEIDFSIESVRYGYGFSTDADAFTSEWLYMYPKNRRVTLFEREGQSFKFGRSLSGRNRAISEFTRNNSLFLSAASQNDHKILKRTSKHLLSMRIDTRHAVEGAALSRSMSNDDPDPRVITFLSRIGTGVKGFRYNEKDLTEMEENVGRNLILRIGDNQDRVQFRNSLNFLVDRTIQLAHQSDDGESVFFELERESAGTRRLLNLLSKVFHALDEGTVLLVDELDASLHTQACEAVIALFSSPDTNPHGAQLIATTHDTNLLRSPFLRRDQIWFTEKDNTGATHIYPLTDIRTRKDDNIEKGYLQGRYGAVPFSGPISDILSDL